MNELPKGYEVHISRTGKSYSYQSYWFKPRKLRLPKKTWIGGSMFDTEAPSMDSAIEKAINICKQHSNE